MSTALASTTGAGTTAGRLEPVRQALLADAADEADRIRTTARDDARSATDDAEDEVAAEVAEVTRRQAIASAAHADHVRAQARAEAHAEMLTTRARIHHDLRAAVRAAALGLRDDERYPALLDHLEALAREQLGADADVERDPPEGGGVVAVAGARRVDYTLLALADRALRDHADEVVVLWT